jgi:hypothetical protein
MRLNEPDIVLRELERAENIKLTKIKGKLIVSVRGDQ